MAVAAMHGAIPVEDLKVPAAAGASGATLQNVLVHEVPGVTTDFLTITGPDRWVEPGTSDHEVVWLFIGGRAELQIKDQKFSIATETVARAPLGWSWQIDVPKGSVLLALRIRKQLSDEDRTEYSKFPQYNAAAYVKAFTDCTPYREAIKSPKTVSRTLLPENYVPRMAIGTVETAGPDQVRRHKHPMLEQYFLGLRTNQSIVSADNDQVALPEYSILHIPLGSMHGARVTDGHHLYYVWIDFFTTREGQEWLKMHKPIEEKTP